MSNHTGKIISNNIPDDGKWGIWQFSHRGDENFKYIQEGPYLVVLWKAQNFCRVHFKHIKVSNLLFDGELEKTPPNGMSFNEYLKLTNQTREELGLKL